MSNLISRIFADKLVAGMFILLIPALLLYSLDTSPRPWHDEGAAMLIAKTLVEDGTYAVKTSTGYQTFGPVQSVGPTVVLPVALSFKVFGVGVLQGRLVIVIYSYMTLLIIYKLMRAIFNKSSAVLGLFLLLGSASSQFLYFGRQVLGEVPALGLFLGGWYFWLLGRQRKVNAYFGVAGLLIGAAMVTKSSYVVIAGLLFFVMGILDIFYYRQKSLVSLIGIAGIAFFLFSLWTVFQMLYFGTETFLKNADLLSQLGQATTGFSLSNVFQQAKFLIGSKNDYFYFLWGIPAILYAVVLCLRRDEYGFLTSVLTIFTVLWLAYYFYSVPWPAYLFAPAAIVSLIVGKLWSELISNARVPLDGIVEDIKNGKPTAFGLFVALIAGLFLFIFYPLQNAVQFNILSKDHTPQQAADLLSSEINPDIIVETWERELGVLTDHRYHYPDQSLLIEVHAAKYRENSQDYLLGLAYFESVRPSYVVIGRFAKEFPVYDPVFLSTNATLIAQIGTEGPASYEIYEINYPLIAPK